MLTITDLAKEKLQEYMTSNNLNSPVRVAMMNSCSGASLGLALDDRKDDDTALEVADLQLIMDNALLSQCGATTIDFKAPSGCGCGGGGGFVITTAIPLPSSGGCGGSCSSGGCGC